MTIANAVTMADILSAATRQRQYVVSNGQGDYWVRADLTRLGLDTPYHAYYTAVPNGYCGDCDGCGIVPGPGTEDVTWEGVPYCATMPCPRCKGTGEGPDFPKCDGCGSEDHRGLSCGCHCHKKGESSL